MNHVHRFPHSHKHLLSFSVLAIAMALIVANTAVAEDKVNYNFGKPQFDKSDMMGPPNMMDNGKNKPMMKPDFKNEDNKFGNQKENKFKDLDNLANFGEDGMMKKQNGMMGNENSEEGEGDDQNEQFERQMVENAQKQVKNVEQQLKQFDKKVQSLVKQGLTAPAEFSATLAKVKAIILAVKNAKTVDELEAAGWDDLRDEMSTLYENQKLLEQLAQWPKTLKMIDSQIKTQTKNLARYRALTEKLQKKEVDVSSLYAELETAVNSLKTIRDEAAAKATAGDVESAFDILEDKLYDVAETIKDKQGIMQTLSNVGQFAGEFKKAQKQMTKVIAHLKKRKIDTTELTHLQANFNQKGQVVQQLIKARPINMDAITEALEDLFDAKQDFIVKMQTVDEEPSTSPNSSFTPGFQF